MDFYKMPWRQPRGIVRPTLTLFWGIVDPGTTLGVLCDPIISGAADVNSSLLKFSGATRRRLHEGPTDLKMCSFFGRIEAAGNGKR